MHKPAMHARYQLEKLQILQEKQQVKDVLVLKDITKLAASSVQNVPLNAKHAQPVLQNVNLVVITPNYLAQHVYAMMDTMLE